MEIHLQHLISTASHSHHLKSLSDSRRYIQALEAAREEARAQIKSNPEFLERLRHILSVEADRLLVDAATLLGVGLLLQKQLTDRLRQGSEHGQLSQVASHRIVDLWGKLEASRALLHSLVRLFAGVEQGSLRGATLRAQSKVLLENLAETIVDIASSLALNDTFGSVGEIIDWTLALTRGDSYAPLEGAVHEEIRHLAG